MLSAVSDDATRLQSRLGDHDRQRLDQYFTSLRELENQIARSLNPPSSTPARSRAHRAARASGPPSSRPPPRTAC
ncbi:MAG: DUF1552 domain-containing protein [Candidatus Binatia bacterium]